MTQYDPALVAPKADEGRKGPFLNTSIGVALCVFLVVAGLFLLFQHRLHLAWRPARDAAPLAVGVFAPSDIPLTPAVGALLTSVSAVLFNAQLSMRVKL